MYSLDCLTYIADKRTSAWLKLKKDYVLGVGDSLDLVPIGAWHGNGRKAAWWSPILLAVWDEKAAEFVGVCKCMSGTFSSPQSRKRSLTKRHRVLRRILQGLHNEAADSVWLLNVTQALNERYKEGTADCSSIPRWNANTGGWLFHHSTADLFQLTVRKRPQTHSLLPTSRSLGNPRR